MNSHGKKTLGYELRWYSIKSSVHRILSRDQPSSYPAELFNLFIF